MTDADIRFYFDPVCPFAWITSKWVRMVAAQRGYAVDWRFVSLRMTNSQTADHEINGGGGACWQRW
jgi:2-hydroxychromene-2-carboxylate isomerase